MKKQDQAPAFDRNCPEGLCAAVTALAEEQDENARRMRALEEKLRAVVADMLVYEPATRP